ncbi:tyrosine-type recombinase/integrase [Amycolatopsis acidicola]|uniref:Tyrosine-type recombinase/integrase n=1 Tax=Amycolatopsis acidicola TaxID=2596893 RepID=A0A5N0V502_9PSEU|nr:tyrosine-type recombinase/integrase [Amycolatopsis acidicola]
MLDDALMAITAAYTGLRWGELAGLQWIRTHLDNDPRIEIDPDFGALHEVRGRLTLGTPKTPASVRTVDLPPFLNGLLSDHHDRNPGTKFVFAGRDGRLHRRSNFRQRSWVPALVGDEALGWAPIHPGMRFHDLRHTQQNLAHRRPRPLSPQRLGHERRDTADTYRHVTRAMIAVLELFGSWNWDLPPATPAHDRVRRPERRHKNGPTLVIQT